MGITEMISFDTPTILIHCDFCEKSMYMNEIEKIQNFPLTGKAIIMCGNCAGKLNKKALERYIE